MQMYTAIRPSGRDRASIHADAVIPVADATYLRERYAPDGGRVADLAPELDVALPAVVAEMNRAAIPRRPRGEPTARGPAARRARLAAR
jgi:hypothetical protein